jgi:hypothetical protein
MSSPPPKALNYIGLLLGVGALLVLLLGVAFALQVATRPESRAPAQAADTETPTPQAPESETPSPEAATDTPTPLPPTEPRLFYPVPMMYSTFLLYEHFQIEGYSLIPGEGFVTVELLWHATAAPPRDYLVGVYLLPDGVPSGTVPLATHDSVPAFGARPTTGWQPDEYILDRHDLSIPPDMDTSNLVVWVIVYDPETGQRVPVETPGGPVDTAPIGPLAPPPAFEPTPTPFPIPTEGTAGLFEPTATTELTATPFAPPTDWTPDPCSGTTACTPAPTEPGLDLTLTAVWATLGVTPTACQVGCPETPAP